MMIIIIIIILILIRCIDLIRSMPSSHEAASTILLLSHNLNGQLFHLPLFHLLLSHLHNHNSNDDDEEEEEGDKKNMDLKSQLNDDLKGPHMGHLNWYFFSSSSPSRSHHSQVHTIHDNHNNDDDNNSNDDNDDNGNDGDNDSENHNYDDNDDENGQSSPHFSLRKLMCLNIIVDLCRLLSHGYSHVYTVYNLIRESLHPHLVLGIDNSKNQADLVSFTLWDYLCSQYHLYKSHCVLEEGGSRSFFYLRYLQALQKVVYLIIIDDYLSVCSDHYYYYYYRYH